MFASLFHRVSADRRPRVESAALETLDQRLLDDLGLTRCGFEQDGIDVGELAASSLFPLHDVRPSRPVRMAVDPRLS